MHLAMVKACRLLLACTIVGALVARSSDSSSDASSGLPSARAADVSPRTSPSATASEQQGESDPLDDLAKAASHNAAALRSPTRLLILNQTSHEVLLTSVHGDGTATVAAGSSVRLASKRVCGWLPLRASTANGRVIELYGEPCRGQTWTITEPG